MALRNFDLFSASLDLSKTNTWASMEEPLMDPVAIKRDQDVGVEPMSPNSLNASI